MRIIAKFFEVTATFDVNGHSFVAKGKTVTSNGWKSYTQECDKNKDKSLPDITQGQVFDKIKSALSEHHTSPPKAYTEDTLLMEMERAGNKNNTDDEDNPKFPKIYLLYAKKCCKAGYYVIHYTVGILPTV